MRGNKLGKVYLILVFVVLYAPIFYLMFYSFNSGESMRGFEGFTLDWYKEVFQDTRLIIIALNTLIIALLSATISTILGVFGALAISYVKRRQARNTLETLNNVLIVSPDVIIGASFLILFTIIGIKLGFTSVLLSHIAFSVPIVVIMVLPKLLVMCSFLIYAARDLGYSIWYCLSMVFFSYLTTSIF